MSNDNAASAIRERRNAAARAARFREKERDPNGVHPAQNAQAAAERITADLVRQIRASHASARSLYPDAPSSRSSGLIQGS